MVIQRWQSVWLLVAAVCVALFCFMPMALVSVDALQATTAGDVAAATGAATEAAAGESATFISPSDNWVVMIVGLLTTLLLIINIFSFKDTRRQKRMTIMAVVLIAVLAACAVLIVYGAQTEGARIEWMGSILLLLGAVAFSLLAYRGIRHDEKLLKAADRLR